MIETNGNNIANIIGIIIDAERVHIFVTLDVSFFDNKKTLMMNHIVQKTITKLINAKFLFASSICSKSKGGHS